MFMPLPIHGIGGIMFWIVRLRVCVHVWAAACSDRLIATSNLFSNFMDILLCVVDEDCRRTVNVCLRCASPD